MNSFPIRSLHSDRPLGLTCLHSSTPPKYNTLRRNLLTSLCLAPWIASVVYCSATFSKPRARAAGPLLRSVPPVHLLILTCGIDIVVLLILSATALSLLLRRKRLLHTPECPTLWLEIEFSIRVLTVGLWMFLDVIFSSVFWSATSAPFWIAELVYGAVSNEVHMLPALP